MRLPPSHRRIRPRRRRKQKRNTLRICVPPSPFDGWDEHEQERHEDAVIDAWPEGAERPTYDKGDRPRPIPTTDLALALFAVERRGEKGLSYQLLARCFRECKGKGCHRNLAAALLRTLEAWKLIIHVANYRKGKRGNVYLAVGSAEHEKYKANPSAWVAAHYPKSPALPSAPSGPALSMPSMPSMPAQPNNDEPF